MNLTYLIIIFIALIATSWGMTHILRHVLIKKSILDIPNIRSSHTIPTPRGGGLVVSGLIIIGLITQTILTNHYSFIPIILGVASLMLVSFADDLFNLSPLKRLIVQLTAAYIGFYWISQNGSVLQNIIPFWAEYIFLPILWVGFINFYNFMDGIDGISAVETNSISLGIFLVGIISITNFSPLTNIFDILIQNWHHPLIIIPLFVFAIMTGFMLINWHPAKIFLGDVGSVPLGYLIGALLFYIATQGYLAAAVILPLYYLSDAIFTLIKRASRGERIWEAHKQHFYQQATQKGYSHAKVSIIIAFGNILLISCAIWSLSAPILALTSSFLIILALLFWLKK